MAAIHAVLDGDELRRQLTLRGMNAADLARLTTTPTRAATTFISVPTRARWSLRRP